MPHLYSDQKIRMQAVHTAELISLAIVALQTAVQSSPELSPSWDSIAKYRPPRDPTFSLEVFVSGSRIGRIVDQPTCGKSQPAVQSDSDSDDISSLVESEATSGSESRSETDDEANPEDDLYKPCFQKVEWPLAAGPKGKLHLGRYPDLRCGRSLRSPETGTSFWVCARMSKGMVAKMLARHVPRPAGLVEGILNNIDKKEEEDMTCHNIGMM